MKSAALAPSLLCAGLLASALALPVQAQMTLEGTSVPGRNPAEGAPTQLVVLLHGYTQTGAAMSPLAGPLQARLPHAAIAYPDAPLEAQGGRSWYNFRGEDAETSRTAAREGVQALVAELTELYGIEPGNVAIAGFSQGGGVALGAATCASPDLGAAVSIAGVVDSICDPETEGAKTAFLFVHSINDPTVPLARGEAAVELVNEAGYEATMEAFEGNTHWPSREALQRVQDFIVEALTE